MPDKEGLANEYHEATNSMSEKTSSITNLHSEVFKERRIHGIEKLESDDIVSRKTNTRKDSSVRD
jgi:hypothetical protein